MEHTKKSLLRRVTQIAVTTIFCLMVLLCLAVLGFRGYMMLSVYDYYKASEKAFLIPGLDENMVPQGFCYDAERDIFIVSAYSAGDDATALYAVDAKTGDMWHKTVLAKENGDDFTGHAGGVAQFGNYIYVAGSSAGCLYIYDYGTVLTAERAVCIGTFSLKASKEDYIRASFVYAGDGRLVVGEYFAPGYETPDSHKVTTSDGAVHGGLALEFRLDASAKWGIDPTPVRALSIKDQVQGVILKGDTLYLSTSGGLHFSHIYQYDLKKATSLGSITVLGREMPLYAPDANCLTHTYQAPPMAEEMVLREGKLYIMCESACSKYIFGKFTEGRWCYATDLEKMKGD